MYRNICAEIASGFYGFASEVTFDRLNWWVNMFGCNDHKCKFCRHYENAKNN